MPVRLLERTRLGAWVLLAAASLVLSACLSPSLPASGPKQGRIGPTASIYASNGLELTKADITDAVTPAKVKTSQVRAFYDDQEDATIFYRNGRWTPAATQALTVLRNAAREGLSPEAYLPASLLMARSLSGRDPKAVDVQLTLGLLAYISDVHQGAHNPRKKAVASKLLREGLEWSNFGAYLSDLPPRGRSYIALRRVLNGSAGTLSLERKKQVAATMERLRWDHEAVGAARDLRVNIPSQTLEIFERGRLVRTMNTVVGRESRKTPALQDKVVSLKFSPDWTAPRSIVQEDYLNQAQSDATYFDEKGWTVIVDGEQMASAAIDWETVDLDRVTVRQPSGASNALGGVRFSLTNSQAIYLHDTNAHNLFEKEQRLYSSGCVRVEDAAWLAHWILSGEARGMSMDEVRQNMALTKPKSRRLENHVPVSIAYMTVWVDGTNTLHWEEDVYGHDAQLLRKMRFPAAWGG